MSTLAAENINNKFFDGRYKDIWRALIPEALTNAEVDWMMADAKLKRNDKVLDVMCGYGRHALSLARKGISVTAVDNLVSYVNEINELASKENLAITALPEDVLHFRSPEEYDLIICMGNSMSFFNKEDSGRLFSNICSHLKPNGKAIFNSWLIAEIVYKHFQESSWAKIMDIKCLYTSRYLSSPSRIETESIFIAPDGDTEIKHAVDYIYSLNETEVMLNKAGLDVKEFW